jgi:hypothetical protein
MVVPRVLLQRFPMERLLARLERRFGSIAIQNLILYIVGGTALVWVLALSRPGYLDRLTLDIDAVRHGEVWRLVTFLFLPPRTTPAFFLLNLYFTWWVGSSLEQYWGSFKFNAYIFLGALATIIAAVITGAVMSNDWLLVADGALVLAFATVFPDAQVFLLFIPVRAKWLGIIAVGMLSYFFATGDEGSRASILAAVSAYAVFFAEHWWGVLRQTRALGAARVRRARFESNAPTGLGQRACAICGAKETDGTDIRVCSCEKCGGKARALCLSHARSH